MSIRDNVRIIAPITGHIAMIMLEYLTDLRRRVKLFRYNMRSQLVPIISHRDLLFHGV